MVELIKINMKKIILLVLFYVIFSIIYVMIGLNIFSKCYESASNYKNCLPIEYVEVFIKIPAVATSRYTPIKFIWGDDNKSIGIGNYTYGGLKIGNQVIFQSWQKFMPI